MPTPSLKRSDPIANAHPKVAGPAAVEPFARDAGTIAVADFDDTDWGEVLDSCKTGYDVFRRMRALVGAFDYATFIVLRLPATATATLGGCTLISNWPPELIRAYDDNDMLATSPVVAHCRERSDPLLWDIAEIAGRMPEAKASFALELFLEFGMARGAYLPVHTPGDGSGAIGFAGERGAPSARELQQLAWLSSLVFTRLVHINQPAQPSARLLTDRERECLRWTASGKTSGEIATILGISSHTVDHHLNAAGQKLNTTNRAHTVATALRLRLID